MILLRKTSHDSAEYAVFVRKEAFAVAKAMVIRMIALYKKELKSFFTTLTGWIFIAVLLLFTGIFTYAINLTQLSTQFEFVLNNISFIFLLITPVLTMRILSEERRAKTDQLLFSLPLGTGKIVCAKYFAMLTVFAVPTVLMLFFPMILSLYGVVNFASAYSCIAGFFFLGAALIAVGLFISALTESQIVAAVTSFGVLLVVYLMGSLASFVPSTAISSLIAFTVLIALVAGIVYLMTKNFFAAGIFALLAEGITVVLYYTKQTLFENAFARVLRAVSLFDRFYSFINGVFDLTAVVYFVSVAVLFVFLTRQAVEKRRWS